MYCPKSGARLCRKGGIVKIAAPGSAELTAWGEEPAQRRPLPRANQVLLRHYLFSEAVLPYRGSASCLIIILADEPPFVIRLIVFQRLSRTYLGLQTCPPSLGSQLPVVCFYFGSVEDDELVVFVIVMSPPPLASFFGLRSRVALFFLAAFLDFFIAFYGVVALLPQGSGGF